MSPSPNHAARAEKIAHAWETHAPEATFAGMTLEQFKAAIKPTLDVRIELEQMVVRTKGLIAKRNSLDKGTGDLSDRIVNGVRADSTHGSDSPLWAAMGFVRKSDRSAGMTRKKAAVKKPSDPS